MTPEYQLIASILTIVLSGVTSATITYKLNKRREEKQLRQQKLEQLYLSFLGFSLHLGTNFLRYVDGFSGKLDLNQIHDMIIKEGVLSDKPYMTTAMLISVYFPEMQPHFDRLIQAREKGNEIVGDYKQGYKTGQWDGKALYQRMCEVVEVLESTDKAFIEAVRTEGKRIARI